MTISLSPLYHTLTVQFSDTVEYQLFPWFDEAFSARVRLNYALNGICKPIHRLFPRYVPADNPSARVFSATLNFEKLDDDVPSDVCLKLARGVDEVVRLSHEASIYRKQLVNLWGIAVPRMYGFFLGHHEDTPVACLLLEFCPGPSAPLRDSETFMCVHSSRSFPPFHFVLTVSEIFVSRTAVQNVRKVHMLGITQNMPLDLRHFVMKDDRLLLVDFSRAVVHRCNNVTLVYSLQRFWLNREGEQEVYNLKHDCGELMTTAKRKMRAASAPHRQ